MCSASASSLPGIFFAPLLVGTLVVRRSVAGRSAMDTMLPIAYQLLPFIAGQLLRPVIGIWVGRYKPMLKFVGPRFDPAGGVHRFQ